MSKAIFVMDEMPDNCIKCRVVCDWMLRAGVKRPEMCPLKEMPAKTRYGENVGAWDDGYQTGWNACLDKIGDRDAREQKL